MVDKTAKALLLQSTLSRRKGPTRTYNLKGLLDALIHPNYINVVHIFTKLNRINLFGAIMKYSLWMLILLTTITIPSYCEEVKYTLSEDSKIKQMCPMEM